ncbi:hypothetical protein, partial [Uliginosibacterium sediminicola]
PKTETQPKTKHPHLSVVTFLKSFTAFTALFFTANRCCLRCISFSEGRILHAIFKQSSTFEIYFSVLSKKISLAKQQLEQLFLRPAAVAAEKRDYGQPRTSRQAPHH